ncbi:MAG: aminotransferase class V-fold PLP-dependent enzyme, partial [Verrucomicrobiaceae bacterium]|nr:aminotransferase class V-fold PLP-dependent enzyme [Verrucomicrobiaceae bacterium]
MNVDRRRFLQTTGLTLAGFAALSRSIKSATALVPPPVNFGNWESIRQQFPISTEYIHLSSFFLAAHPRPVHEAIENYRRELDANPLAAVEEEEFGKRLRVERVVAEYVGGKPNEIALTDSTTMGLALIYHGLPFKAGDEILTTAHDHYAHHESIRLAAERVGAKLRKIALFDAPDKASEAEIVERIRKAITPKTRALGVTWVQSSSGVRLPIRSIARAVAEANKGRSENDRLLLVVDGVHGTGAVDETIAEMGADFFSAGTHKWMFGPRGTGFIWGKAENWKLMRPLIPSFADGPYGAWMADRSPGETEAEWVSPGGFHSFEHRWALPSAFDFHRHIGRAEIAKRIEQLNTMAKDGLSKIAKVKLHTPREPALSAGVICFDIEGMKPAAVVERLLAKKVIASETPYGRS